MKRPDQRGFSLIELMVAVAIIGVLTAIAVPSYRNYIVKSSRASAQNQLLKLASLQEKIYLNSSAYTANLTTAYNGNTTGGLGITSGKSDDGRYTFAIEQSGQQYQISATPVAGTSQVGDGCLVILESGLRGWFKGDDAPCVAPPPFAGYTAW